jgi:hypothetical protein
MWAGLQFASLYPFLFYHIACQQKTYSPLTPQICQTSAKKEESPDFSRPFVVFPLQQYYALDVHGVGEHMGQWDRLVVPLYFTVYFSAFLHFLSYLSISFPRDDVPVPSVPKKTFN